MWFYPSRPSVDRYQVRHDSCLTAGLGDEIVTISRLVNSFSFFRGDSTRARRSSKTRRRVSDRPTRTRRRCRAHIAALLFYFPWRSPPSCAVGAFCASPCREMLINQNSRDYFGLGRPRRPHLRERKLAMSRSWPTPTSRRCVPGVHATVTSSHLDEVAYVWFHLARVRRLLGRTVADTFPATHNASSPTTAVSSQRWARDSVHAILTLDSQAGRTLAAFAASAGAVSP